MNEFISRYASQISGMLTGFDRLVFRGNLSLNHEPGMKGYLWANKVAWKDYAAHVTEVSGRVKEASLQSFRNSQRPIQYLSSAKESKEQMARAIAQRDGITNGPICACTAVEPCSTWRVIGDRDSRKLRLVHAMRQCLFVYHYWIDAVFGFMSARLQTWFPFSLFVYMNGRERLARQMDERGLQYLRHDNCFSWIEDFARAQALMEAQLKTDWAGSLNTCASRIHPLFPELFASYPMQYYWTCFQSEWAMDIVFREADHLRRLYPQLIHLGMVSLSSPDVMRFMDKKITANRQPVGRNMHEVVSDLKVRSEGVRIKHRYGKNSIKLYDKAYSELGAVLRPEVTVNAPEQFRVFRPKQDQPDDAMQWQRMRAGIADLHRRAEVSQKALDRYCNALARVDDTITLGELTPSVEKRVRYNGTSVRPLHPFDPADLNLLQAVNRGEFTINGLRNRDLQALLFSSGHTDQAEKKRRSAIVTRKLRLLRAHGIIQKLPHTHRYQVTDRGRLLLNTVICAQRTTTQQLTSIAA